MRARDDAKADQLRAKHRLSKFVAMKREAAGRWANHVTTATGATWRYLFVLESDIKAAKGSWEALKRLAAERS